MTQPHGTLRRAPPKSAFEFIERGWRPLLAWVCIILVMVPLCVCAAVVVVAFTYGFIRAIMTGTPLPDLTAGWDRVLPSIMPYIGPGLAGLFTLLLSRHREVNSEITGGGQARPPFEALPTRSDSASPSGPPPDDVSGPRPGENWQ